jgi:leucyl aminopeptidase
MQKLVLLLILLVSVSARGGLRLIEFNETYRAWMTPDQIVILETQSDNWMDITEYRVPVASKTFVDPIPTTLTEQAIVNQLLPDVEVANIENTITTLSAFFNRYYRAQSGFDASQWLFNQLVSYSADRDDITVEFFNNTFLVPSVIARIKGADGDEGATRIVIGAHQDSTAGGANARSPGADDDASGSSAVVETFRVLAQSGFKPKRTVEFHLYSGEEAGLLGSQAIASLYAQMDVDVEAMLNLDMVGYGKDDEALGLVTDYVDGPLTSFVTLLIDGYSTLQYTKTQCGYACSDHASWTRNGYRSAFTIETDFPDTDPYIHTDKDTIDKLNLPRASQFVNIAIGFIVELAHGNL